MDNVNVKEPVRDEALHLSDEIVKRLTQIQGICGLAGAAQIGDLPKNATLHAMWAAESLLNETQGLVAQLHKLAARPTTLKVVPGA